MTIQELNQTYPEAARLVKLGYETGLLGTGDNIRYNKIPIQQQWQAEMISGKDVPPLRLDMTTLLLMIAPDLADGQLPLLIEQIFGTQPPSESEMRKATERLKEIDAKTYVRRVNELLQQQVS